MAEADLTSLNTFGLRSSAECLFVIRTEDELADRLAGREGREPLIVLGGGSNVVLRARLPGTVLLMRTRGITVQPTDSGMALVTAAAGERWHDLVRRVLGAGYGGLENLALIPGSVGAAPIQNIGAYGVELADRFERLRALEVASGEIRTFDREGCRFGYRESRFKQPGGERFIILDVTLRVSREPMLVLGYPELSRELAAMGRNHPTPRDVAEAVVRIRRRKLPDPRGVGNVGSFFKNPVISDVAARELTRRHQGLVMHPADGAGIKLAAAQLIDRCGWKGARRGPVGVWQRQALVLVNFGGATAPELLEFAGAIRRDVRERFGVELALEPRILGQD